MVEAVLVAKTATKTAKKPMLMVMRVMVLALVVPKKNLTKPKVAAVCWGVLLVRESFPYVPWSQWMPRWEWVLWVVVVLWQEQCWYWLVVGVVHWSVEMALQQEKTTINDYRD